MRPFQQNAKHPVTARRLIRTAASCSAETADVLWGSDRDRATLSKLC